MPMCGLCALFLAPVLADPTSAPDIQSATRPAVVERVRLLVIQLGVSDPEVRASALDALREMGREAVPGLVMGLTKHPSPLVRAGCARALGRCGADDPAAVAALAEHLRLDSDASVRTECARALGAAGVPSVVKALSAALEDEDESVRAEAALSVGQTVRIARSRDRLDTPARKLLAAVVDPLIEVLRDTSPAVRGNAAMSLGALGDPRALAPLALLTLDRDPLVRASACQGLADLRRVEAVPALLELLDDADPTVRRSSIQALERITGTRLGYRPWAPPGERQRAIQRWRAWWKRTRVRLENLPPADILKLKGGGR